MSRIYELSADDVDNFDFPLEGSSNNVGESSSRAGADLASNMGGMPAGLSSMLAGMMGSGIGMNPPQRQDVDRSKTKNWQTLYPRYLDCKLAYKTGARHVPINYSLRWPTAQLIQHACTQIGLPCQLENDKTHPADWQNPGRVKVLIKRNDKPINSQIPNKQSLLKKIGSLLRPLETARLKLPAPTAGDRKSTPLPPIHLRLPYNSPAISHGFLAMAETESQKSSDPSSSSDPKTKLSQDKTIKPSAESSKKTKKQAPKKKNKAKK